MEFFENQLFHIYNQGNNKRQVFFTDENYKLFLWKMRSHLLPFGNLVAYCLMPNHFHWQFYVEKTEITRSSFRKWVDQIEFSRRKHIYGKKAHPVELEAKRKADKNKAISLNEAIGILQRTYTRSINKERDYSGSLFRQLCKAKDGWINDLITLRKRNGQLDYRFSNDNDYDFQCFNYIHENPKKAGLVDNLEDWEYSSFLDYQGLRKGRLCNVEFGRKLLKI